MLLGHVILKVPRRLTPGEIHKLDLASRNHYLIQRQNVAITEDEPSKAEPEQTSPQKSVHQSWISDLPCFSHDSEMVLPINMIAPGLPGTIQILDNFGRTYVAARKTFQLWGDGLKNKLLARVLFSEASKIEEGETAKVFGAMGKSTEDEVVKTVRNFTSFSCFQIKKRQGTERAERSTEMSRLMSDFAVRARRHSNSCIVRR